MNYIYKIECPITNKIYIGQTNNIERRWYEHNRYLERNEHHNSILQRNYNKYLKPKGLKYIFTVIAQCDKNKIGKFEVHFINKFRNHNLINLTNGGENLSNLSKESLEKRQSTQLDKYALDVYCYTLDGILIGKYRGINNIAKSLNLKRNGVANALRRRIKYGNYLFFRTEQKNIKPYIPNRSGKIVIIYKIDILNSRIYRYDSIEQCSIDNNLNYNSLNSKIRRLTCIDDICYCKSESLITLFNKLKLSKSLMQDLTTQLIAFGEDKIALRLLDNSFEDLLN